MNATRGFRLLQGLLVVGFGVAYAGMSPRQHEALDRLVTGTAPTPEVTVPRQRGLALEPLHDAPDVVSDEELALVLERVRPPFGRTRPSPNHVEHALRTWGVEATFDDPAIPSGEEMLAYLVDHGRFLAAWEGDEVEPLLEPAEGGVAIRFDREPGGSVHHDHWLASLTEAGVPRDQPVYAPGRPNATIEDVLLEALRDFRLDEREVEWSAMAFGLWLPPATTEWRTSDGRTVNFDRLAERLMRGDERFGVCGGTHRVYSLMLLWRLDREFDAVLADETADAVYAHLESIRDLITAAQFPDGHWKSNWHRGAAALEEDSDEPAYRAIIATGHHLEWLAFAPEELHPPREVIRKAADWLVASIGRETPERLRQRYTFYSHVGTALAAWRRTRPAAFWSSWRSSRADE